MSEDRWQIDELTAERDALAARVRAWEGEIERLGRLRERAEGHWQSFNARLHDIDNQRIVLQVTVRGRGTITAADGRPFSGPTLAEQAQYEGLSQQRAQAEREYAEWVAAARVQVVDLGGLDRSWSTRSPTDVGLKMSEARRAQGLTGQRLSQVEAELAKLEEAATAPAPATGPAGGGLLGRLGLGR